MTDLRPSIVVTLPGGDVPELRRQIDVARTHGADLAEVRIDRLPADERARLLDLFPSPLPLVLTFRSHDEGGADAADERARRAALLAGSKLPFRWIDLEFDRDLDLFEGLPSAELLGRIVSCHLLEGGLNGLEQRMRELETVEGVGKLVVRASVGELFRAVVPLLAPARDTEVVVQTTGSSGPILRALARRYRFPFVFASLPASEGAPVEPSQLPVDRLRPFLEAEAGAPLFAVAGRPIAHSRSPDIHTEWMRELGKRGLYIALEFEDDAEFVNALPELAKVGFRGLNVTRPFKQVALGAATEAAPGADVCGAANCLTLSDGAVRADNTDLSAIVRRLTELRDGGVWNGRTLHVVGAGGAARATLAGARDLGARATVVARKPDAARALAQEFGAEVAAPEHRPESPTLVVNATDVGRAAGVEFDPPLERYLRPGSYLLDWVYDAVAPIARGVAVRTGATYEDGWRLFVYQAAASFALWWGRGPSAASVTRLLQEGRRAA